MRLLNLLSEFFKGDPKRFAVKGLYVSCMFVGILLSAKLLYTNIEPIFAPRFNVGLYESDFTAYLTAAHIVKNKQIKDLYSAETQHLYQEKIRNVDITSGVLSFRNPPIVAFMYLPFAYLAIETAYRLNVLLQAMLMGISVACIARVIKIRKGLFILIFLFVPTTAIIFYGQIASLLFLVLLGILFFFKRGNYIAGGVLAGLLFLKPQYLLLIPFLIILSKDRLKFLKGLVLSLGLLVLINFLVYGKSFFTVYPNFVLNGESVNYGTNVSANYNLFGVVEFIKGYLSEPIRLLIAGVTTLLLYITALVLMLKRVRSYKMELLYAAAVIFTLSLNVHTQAVDLIFLLVPLLILCKEKKLIYKLMALAIFLAPLVGYEMLQGAVSIVLTGIGFGIILSLKNVGLIKTTTST